MKKKPQLMWALMNKATGKLDMLTAWQSRQDMRNQCDPQHSVVRVEVRILKRKP